MHVQCMYKNVSEIRTKVLKEQEEPTSFAHCHFSHLHSWAPVRQYQVLWTQFLGENQIHCLSVHIAS